jgi:hypothetical protein
LSDVIDDYKSANQGKIGEQKFSQAFSGIGGIYSKTDIQAIQKYNDLISNGVEKTEAIDIAMKGASNSAKSLVNNSKTATVGIDGLSAAEKTATISTTALGVALNIALSFGISLAIQAIITGITKLIHAEEEAKEKADELRKQAVDTVDNYKKESESLSDLEAQYVSLIASTSDLRNEKEKIITIQDKVNAGIEDERNQIDLLNNSLSENIALLNKQKYVNAQDTIRDLGGEYEEALNFMDKDSLEFKDKKNLYYTSAIHRVTAILGSDNVKKLTTPIGGLQGFIIDSGKGIEKNIELMDKLLTQYSEYLSEKNDPKLYNMYKAEYDSIKKISDEYRIQYQDYQKIIQNVEEAQGIISDYEDALGSEKSKRINSILESAKQLATILNGDGGAVDKYNALQQLKDLKSEAYSIADGNTILISNIDTVFSAFSTGTQSAMESFSNLRSAWFSTLTDIQKNTISNIDKMDKAIKTAIDGGTLSHGDFWELAELDTDNIIRDINLVGNEFKLSEKELVNLKDQYIQKQIESLKVTQAQIKADEVEARQALVLAKKKLTDKSLFDTVKRGSANLNNPAYRAYLDEVNADIEKAENNVKELGDEWTRNNLLIKELNSRLGYTAEMTKAIADAYADSFVNAIDDQIKAVEKEKQALEDEKQVLQDQLDILEEQQKAIEEQIENYKTVAGIVEDEIDKQTEALKKQQEAEEEAIQAKIDALKEEREQKEEENELLEKELAIQEKLRDLEKAKNTKVRVYTESGGWTWGVDKDAIMNAQDAISEAQKAYDEAIDKNNYEAQVKALEEQKETISKSYEERIKEYESYTEEWKTILEEQTNTENERLADEILGVEWREKIKDRDVNILNGFRSDFRSYNSQLSTLVNGEIATLKRSISAKEDEIKAIDKALNKWNDYKTQVQDNINALKDQYDTEKNSMADMAYTDNLTLDNMEIRMWDFKEHYIGYLQEVIDKVLECKDAMDSPTDTSWLTDEMNKIRISLEQWQDTLEELKKYNLHINSEADARYHKEGSYADGGVISYTGRANVHGKPNSVETAFNAAQGRSLYDMVRTGNFANLVASRALEGINRAVNMPTNTNNATTVNVNGTTINLHNVQNPEQFAEQFERYIKTTLTESQVMPRR